MTSITGRAVRSVSLLFLAVRGNDAFAPCRKRIPFSQTQALVSWSLCSVPGRAPQSSLFYRALDEDDDEDAMLRAQVRTPLGYDLRRMLAIEKGKKGSSNATNVSLLRALLINQILILLITSVVTSVVLFLSEGPEAFRNLGLVLQWTASAGEVDEKLWPLPTSVLTGVMASIPFIAFTSWVENSDRRAFARVNFATIAMVMTLFGRRSVPPDDFIPDAYRGFDMPTTTTSTVLRESFVLAFATGFCEETVFRCEIPSVVASLFSNEYGTGNGAVLVAFFVQAALFAIGHLQAGVGMTENAVVVGLQLVNGIGFGSLYLLSDGDLVACMIAHALFDFVVFAKTWNDANNQLEYAERMYKEPLPDDIEKQIETLVKSDKALRDNPRRFLSLKRLFYIFDFDKNKTLSLSEVRKGVAYLGLEKIASSSKALPSQDQVDSLFDNALRFQDNADAVRDSEKRLNLADFIRMYSQSMKLSRP